MSLGRERKYFDDPSLFSVGGQRAGSSKSAAFNGLEHAANPLLAASVHRLVHRTACKSIRTPITAIQYLFPIELL
jgi:hypothetical protein